MTHFQFIVLICAGIVTILGAVSIIVGAVMKKNSNEIKGACIENFNQMKGVIKEMESGAKERSNRVLVLETRFTEIISRLTRLETVVEKNSAMTADIYAYMKHNRKLDKGE